MSYTWYFHVSGKSSIDVTQGVSRYRLTPAAAAAVLRRRKPNDAC